MNARNGISGISNTFWGACPQIPLGGGYLQPPEALKPLTSELIETAGLNWKRSYYVWARNVASMKRPQYCQWLSGFPCLCTRQFKFTGVATMLISWFAAQNLFPRFQGSCSTWSVIKCTSNEVCSLINRCYWSKGVQLQKGILRFSDIRP